MENNNINTKTCSSREEKGEEGERETRAVSAETGKQTRLVRRTARTRNASIASTEQDLDLDMGNLSDCSIASTCSTATSVSSRKRMLPISDGEMPQAKAIRQGNSDENFLAPYVPVTKTRSKASQASLPSAAELGKEMAVQPTGDLGSHIAENLVVIEKIADKSRNLKGEFVRALRVAVRNIQAATTEVVQRAVPTQLESENALLRSRLADLNKEVEVLRTELNELKKQKVPSNSPGRIEPARPAKNTGIDEQSLMDKIGSMMDRKLASFRDELFPGRAVAGIRPPLGQKAPPAAATRSKDAPAPAPAVRVGDAESSWATVTRRKAKARERPPAQPTQEKNSTSDRQPATQATRKKTGSQKKEKKSRKKRLPRVPKSAAVTITVPEGSQVTYAEVMQTAKGRIKLSDLGINEVRPKKAINGGLLLQVSGEDCAGKADALAGKLHEAVAELGVKVARPTKQGEARVMDLDDSVTREDIASAIAKICGCIAGDVKVGEIRRSPKTLGTAWVRCPLAAVRKLAEAKRLLVGWVSARVEVLPARSLQCYRCLEMGHARHQCTSPKDRSALCYVCGEPGHRANQCVAQAPKCVLCADLGRPADHRLGSKKCTPPKRKTTRGSEGSDAVATATSSVRANGLAQPSASAPSPPTETMDAS